MMRAMNDAPPAGTPLAHEPGMPLREAAEWQGGGMRDLERRLVAARPALMAIAYAAFLVSALALGFTGYPTWRVAVLLICGAAVVPLEWKIRPSRGGVTSAARVVPMIVALVLVCAGVTGGLHSPWVFFVPLLTSTLFPYQWTRRTRSTVAVATIGVVALLAIPAPFLGPEVPRPVYLFTAALTLALIGWVSLDFQISVMQALRAGNEALLRARDQVATQALARAHDLELHSAKLSHELKNPLAAIKALVQLSRRDTSGTDARERLAVLESEVDRMHGILQDYLTFSRPLEKLRTEDLDLADLVDEVLSVLEGRAAAAGVTLSREGQARVHADARRLKEALINLVANAIEATPCGGRVGVRLTVEEALARIVVHDTGRGMTTEVLERLGSPFFTTREDGTGLGVLLARAILLQHGGSLDYESVVGDGTSVTATLPVAGGEGGRHGAAAAG